VSNIGQAVNPTTDAFEYSVTLTIVKTVTKVSVAFSFPMQVTSVAVLTEGWVVTFDGTKVNTTLEKTVAAGTALKTTLKVTLAAGATFNFPTALATACVFNGNAEAQNFNFAPSSVPPPVIQPGSNNFISTAGQSLKTDGAGTHEFTFTFKPFRVLTDLTVQFAFPNTKVLTAVSTTDGATAAFQDGKVTVTYAGVPADTVSTTVKVTTDGPFTLPNQLIFTTGSQTQTMDFAPSAPSPTNAAQKPLAFSHINHGIKAGRSYLEVAYYIDITAGSDLESYSLSFTLPMAVSSAAGDATTTAALTADTNSVKLSSTAPLAKGAKATLTVY
jgi:hypothetical protein